MLRKTLLFLIALFVLTACNDREPDYVIGVSSCSNDMWREKLNEEMLLSTYLYDNVRLVISSANDDDKRQIEQIDSFINQGVDLLIISPNQLNTISPAIERAYRHHIPVVLFDRKTGTRHYTAYIGADNYKVGQEMGRFVARHMKGRGNLVVIKGLKGSSPTIERNRGFMSIINKYPDIRIVADAYAGWLQDEARVAMESILRNTKDIDCVFAQNDRMALGARQAVTSSGLKRSIDYIGVDALPSKGGGLECVSRGLLTASYIYPTRGDLVLNLAMNILQGRPYRRENRLDGALVTKDNAGVLILQNEELAKQRSRLYVLSDKVDKYLIQYSHQRVYAIMAVIIMILVIVTFALIYRSIIVRRRMAEQVADARLTFFTNVSHEFRTPLTLIADPVDRLLSDPDTTGNQRGLLLLVRRNIDVMLRLVTEILDFRKVQKGKMALRLSRFNMTDSLHLWVQGFKTVADSQHITLSTDIQDGIIIIADHDKLEAVVYNLLSNAIKFTPTGGHVCMKAFKDEGQLMLSVHDDGQGMTEEEARHAFDRFYQSDRSTGGTGIGLALVKAFIQMHHGNVNLSSTPAQGSTFIVSIPLEQKGDVVLSEPLSSKTAIVVPETTVTDHIEPTSADIITEPAEVKTTVPLVLVADDNHDIRAYIVSLLSDGFKVIEAADGNAALKLAMNEVPDIVIADVMMPGLDGLELCRRLKAERITSHIPVILLTARTQDFQRTEGYDCGADSYITKPFSGQLLTARVRNLLEGRRRLKTLYGVDDIVFERPQDADARFMADFGRVVGTSMSDSSLSVETISAALGMSRVQMYRKVKALTGTTPVELIRRTRLKRADLLLRQGSITVAEVAYRVGFSSPSYFAKCFKEYFGRLPSE